MKKVLFIMAAALLMMTQCRKQETSPVTPSADTIKMTVTAGSGAKTDINTSTGAITWSAGDKLYVSDGTSWLGSLTLVSGADTPQGTFTGSVTGLDDEGAPCHFFYLGHDNGMTEPTGTAAVNISFAAQDGTLAGAMKYHMGYGRTDVTVESGEYQGYVLMNTKIAIAHFNFTTDGTSAYTGSVTMGGTGIGNTMTVSPDGIFTGGGDGGITIAETTTGEKYVTLIPTTETDVVRAEFTGDATGSLTFANGIQANKFYGMSNAMVVTVTPKPKFSVGENTTVEFAPGNLYWDGTDSKWKFEANQWSTTPASDGTWDASHVSHFKWSNAENAVTGNTTYAGTSLFCANNFTVAGDSHTWRTLTDGEWKYLLNTSNASSGARTDANRFAKARVSGVAGLLVFPDGYNDGEAIGSITGVAALNTTNAAYPTESILDATWTSMESAGVVFLPAAGGRDGTGVYGVGSHGDYWSSTPSGSGSAYNMYFDSGYVDTNYSYRYLGYSVRLVRSAS